MKNLFTKAAKTAGFFCAMATMGSLSARSTVQTKERLEKENPGCRVVPRVQFFPSGGANLEWSVEQAASNRHSDNPTFKS